MGRISADNGRIPIGRIIVRSGFPPAGVSYEANNISQRMSPNGWSIRRVGYLPLIAINPTDRPPYAMDPSR